MKTKSFRICWFKSFRICLLLNPVLCTTWTDWLNEVDVFEQSENLEVIKGRKWLRIWETIRIKRYKIYLLLKTYPTVCPKYRQNKINISI